MKIGIILGTRPEIVKMASIIRECMNRRLDFFILHTNQHYRKNLDSIFFSELKLPKPKYNLNIGSGTHSEETGKMLMKIEKVLMKERPGVVLVEGDTNTVLAGALAAAKLHIKVGHVEAGLRSYFRRMPEELNRTITDHCSDLLFAPTDKARNILLAEGISPGKIFVTGNTIVDAVYQNVVLSRSSSRIIERLRLKKDGYIVMTLHRQENVDNRSILGSILGGLRSIRREFGVPIIYPIHPRAKKMMLKFALSVPEGVRTIEPVGYMDFLNLEENAKLILTDSGGIQEEACILRVPCVTLRDNTERPETLEVGSNILAGTRQKKILNSARMIVNRKRDWKNPFGDGRAGSRIVKIITGKM
ncbi:MAG: UDP-N-acetylglucosamine 2-epimerase (non-hydrolyzing) [Candidatus Omnitrophica bacterium]|nr:UDP-N-acetylglucosamine 2-epimerase (non-hydrolyzing) [Candidatus Omnitrophota bacterium]